MNQSVRKVRMKKNLLHYKEFGDDKARSLTEDFAESSYYGKDKVIKYLSAGKIKVITTSYGIDCVTGERTGIERAILTDGEYTWSSMLPYYVEKYNYKPPEDFIKKILS